MTDVKSMIAIIKPELDDELSDYGCCGIDDFNFEAQNRGKPVDSLDKARISN